MDPTPDPLDVLSALARTRRASLAALARSEGATPEDAVDCVQEALCTLLTQNQLATLPVDSDALGAVLAATVRNAARNRRRRHFRAAPHEELDAQAVGDGAPTDVLIARAEEHVRLRACVAELCEIQKAVVTLRMLEESSGEDVARALGISPGYVAVLLHRARHALRECMASGEEPLPSVGSFR